MTNPALPSWLEAFRGQLAAAGGGPVELVETHISWVLLAGEFAYKLKKPVVFPFLDYGSPARRAHHCQEELRLNRRFAPGLYLDVVDVPGCSEVAVRMRRFPASARLDQVCVRGDLTPAHLVVFAGQLQAWQAAAPVAPAGGGLGDPGRLLDLARNNFPPLRVFLGESAAVDRLAAWIEQEFVRRRLQLAARCRAQRIREGHGDLHLENLVLIDDTVLPFDGIEFNPELRWIDVALDAAFPYADLLAHGRPDLAAVFLNAWLEASGDHDALGVFRLFAVYRLLVRAMVAALRQDAGAVRHLLAVARALSQPPAAQLLITFGLSGSGKTWQSGQWLLADPAAQRIRLRSDIERLRPPPSGRTTGGLHTRGRPPARYRPAARAAVYGLLARKAASALAAGWSVVVDATFLRRHDRERFRRLARRLGRPFAILACTAPRPVLEARLRTRRGDASEATVEVLARQIAAMEPLTRAERAIALTPGPGQGGGMC